MVGLPRPTVKGGNQAGEQAHQAVAVARIVGARERRGDVLERGERMAGAEAVDVRQARTPRARGAKPSKRSSGFSQMSRRAESCRRSTSCEPVGVVAIEAVGDQDDTMRPGRGRGEGAVEGVQAGASAGAARPVAVTSRPAARGRRRRRASQVAGDVGEAGPEEEGVTVAAAGVGGGVEEVEQQAE